VLGPTVTRRSALVSGERCAIEAMTFCDLKNYRIYHAALGRSEESLESYFVYI
jgi:hypothetical protein